MMRPQEWRFGKHIARWEAPDVLWMRIDGANGMEETPPMVKLLETLAEQGPFFVLADFKGAGALDPEARRYMSERVRSAWFLGLILYDTRLLHRAMARGLIFAAELFHAVPGASLMRQRLHFASTQDDAQAMLEQLRVQVDGVSLHLPRA